MELKLESDFLVGKLAICIIAAKDDKHMDCELMILMSND